jgi:hypothetical protein
MSVIIPVELVETFLVKDKLFEETVLPPANLPVFTGNVLDCSFVFTMGSDDEDNNGVDVNVALFFSLSLLDLPLLLVETYNIIIATAIIAHNIAKYIVKILT